MGRSRLGKRIKGHSHSQRQYRLFPAQSHLSDLLSRYLLTEGHTGYRKKKHEGIGAINFYRGN